MPETPVPSTVSAVLEILAVLVPLLKGIISPELTDQIDKEIASFRAKREKLKADLQLALNAMDVPKINALLAELMS